MAGRNSVTVLIKATRGNHQVGGICSLPSTLPPAPLLRGITRGLDAELNALRTARPNYHKRREFSKKILAVFIKTKVAQITPEFDKFLD